MRKLTGGLIGVALLLCAFTAQAAEPVDVFGVSSEPMAMTIVICSSNSDCASGAECLSAKVCVDDITSMPTSASCTTDDDCDVGSSCQETSICSDVAECASDADCAGNPGGEICNLSTGQCVECLKDDNCTEGAFCDRGMCSLYEDCDLIIKPARVKISGKQKKPFVIKLLRIKGNENFVPKGSGNACSSDDECASGEKCSNKKCEIAVSFDMSFVGDPNFTPGFPADDDDFRQMIAVTLNGTQAKKRMLKVRTSVGTGLDPGTVPMRVGKCLGEFELQ